MASEPKDYTRYRDFSAIVTTRFRFLSMVLASCYTCSNCARVAYNSQFTESKLNRVAGRFCGILLNHFITTGSGRTAVGKQPE